MTDQLAYERLQLKGIGIRLAHLRAQRPELGAGLTIALERLRQASMALRCDEIPTPARQAATGCDAAPAGAGPSPLPATARRD